MIQQELPMFDQGAGYEVHAGCEYAFVQRHLVAVKLIFTYKLDKQSFEQVTNDV